MRRRKFLNVLGSTAIAWPLLARAQQPAMPVIGYLYTGSPEPTAHLMAAFRKGLGEAGYFEGRNVAIEYRWAHYETDRLPGLVADLVRRRVDIIVTPGSTPAALAAKAANTTLPIVFGIGSDPVEIGLVASLSRPGANVTGVSFMNAQLGAKRLGLLQELLPGAARFAIIAKPNNLSSETIIKDVQAAASTTGRHIEVFYVSNNREIDTAFATLVQKQSAALLVCPDPLFSSRRLQLVMLAVRHAVPTICANREDVEGGALMSYGSSFPDLFRQMGIYTGRILRGEKPADLPVARATKFEFVINLQTAKTLGIDIPAMLLAQADEVIE